MSHVMSRSLHVSHTSRSRAQVGVCRAALWRTSPQPKARGGNNSSAGRTHQPGGRSFDSAPISAATSSSPPSSSSSEQCEEIVLLKTVQEGDALPDVKLSYFDEDGNMREVTTRELFAGKKVVLFAVPGAFTPTCSTRHLPGFVKLAPTLREKGVDEVACVSVNDAFVMDAWSKSVGTQGEILMLADGSAKLARELGVELDLTDKGLGLRSRRYAMLIDDCVITHLNLEEGGAFTVSSAEDMLKWVDDNLSS
ncbi:peroxiredoxin [Pseudoscourfieldia marina]